MTTTATLIPTAVACNLGSMDDWRRAARQAVGLPHATVAVVLGDQPPRLVEPGGYYTASGHRIRHPSAYRRKGYSSMEYRRQRVEVGADWLPPAGTW